MNGLSVSSQPDSLTIGLAQIAPVWLDRRATLVKVCARIDEAAVADCALVVFGEALVPGYPFWLERTDAARFNSPLQKRIHAHYLDQAVCIERGDLDTVCAAAARGGIAVYLGIIERPLDRGGHSVYCSLVFIDAAGRIGSIHRKLMPTYEERLSWSSGDGHGLVTHRLGAFTAGGLNCWENWLPLARAALHAQGEDLHIAVWPGARRNTQDITRFMALEGRSFVVSVSGLMRREDIAPELSFGGELRAAFEPLLADGGSCVAGPDSSWLLEPLPAVETLAVVTLDHRRVREDRQNLDISGHYARPDVLQLRLCRERQSVLSVVDAPGTD